jgi:hypothetical protein
MDLGSFKFDHVIPCSPSRTIGETSSVSSLSHGLSNACPTFCKHHHHAGGDN